MRLKSLHSSVYKAISVILSILFCWGFGIMLLVVVLNLVIGFTENDADFRAAFLDRTASKESDLLQDYLELTLRTDSEQSAEPDTDYSYSVGNASNLAQNLHYYESHFDPKVTNYRFAVTDPGGNLLLTNDAHYSQDSPVLASKVKTVEAVLDSRDYPIQKHFDDPAEGYDATINGNPALFLENPQDFQLWYFTNNQVDQAYHDGFSIITCDQPYTDYMLFESEEEARDFDYAELYGDSCTWKIAASAAVLPQEETENEDDAGYGDVPEDEAAEFDADADIAASLLEGSEDSSAHTVVVEIHAYGETEELPVMLGDYYNMKRNGMVVYAEDPELERLLMSGLDVTVVASHVDTQLCYIRSYLPDPMPINDTIRNNYAVFSLLFRHSEWVVVMMFVLLVLAISSCIAMCTAAGYQEGTDRIVVSRVHKIAYECFWLLPPLSMAGSLALLYVLFEMGSPYRMIAIFCLGMILCISACSILWLYTTAIRSKAGTFWSSFGLTRFFAFLFGLFRNRTVTMIAAAAYAIFLFLLNGVLLPQGTIYAFPIIGLDAVTLFGIIYCIYAYFELHRHVREMEQGDFAPASHPIPLALDFAGFDTSLNDITNRVSDIVAQQTRAEHLRTELITNVSHDLKTPLTSIVNYVDLLSREPMPNEAAKEYLDVLRRQAARLKKLTIDLVDASKASTGNLTVELVPTGLQVLISQLAGEYEDLMRAKQLTLVLNVPEEPVTILADGRQIWRVFDNLLNNVCKYALPGTRVYLDAEQDGTQVSVTLKNVSAQPLNVSPDELMERFVRGDASRHTEGSGLGLSIARDLTVLQNGILQLSTDGDLFKAQLIFPLYFPPEILLPNGTELLPETPPETV